MIKKRLLGFMSLCAGIAIACSTTLGLAPSQPTDVDRVKGLQALYQLPAGTHVHHCDLSHSGLKQMPNLSMYTIDTLDLSHNALQEIAELQFPEGVVVLDLSNNQIGAKEKEAHVEFHNELFPQLTTLNISHNKVFYLLYPLKLQHLNVSHNVLRFMHVNATSWQNNLLSLDISHNWDFNGKFYYDYKLIPTIKRDSCARDREFMFIKYH